MTQIKSSIASLTSRMDHLYGRVFGLEDQVEELDHSVKVNDESIINT